MAAGTDLTDGEMASVSLAALAERVAALEAAVAMLMDKLLARGDITVNDAREASGLDRFPEPFPEFTLAIRGDPVKDGCQHVMTGGCPLACFSSDRCRREQP